MALKFRTLRYSATWCPREDARNDLGRPRSPRAARAASSARRFARHRQSAPNCSRGLYTFIP
eukprot:6762889-Alexandrium_andersonii.AAC.1